LFEYLFIWGKEEMSILIGSFLSILQTNNGGAAFRAHALAAGVCILFFRILYFVLFIFCLSIYLFGERGEMNIPIGSLLSILQTNNGGAALRAHALAAEVFVVVLVDALRCDKGCRATSAHALFTILLASCLK
jgi:hypothetical protein